MKVALTISALTSLRKINRSINIEILNGGNFYEP
jgi:hypothetical protein